MSARSHIPLSTKLAAALCVIFKIPHEHAEAMSEKQVLSLAQWDHYPIPKAHDGPDTHYNLMPRLIPEHREKTAKRDQPMIAKARRVQRAEQRHVAVIAAKGSPELAGALETLLKPKRRWPSRPFNSKGKHPMRRKR